MATFVRMTRLRFRLRLVWWLTGHRLCKPLYPAEVVSHDLMEQAQFLCDGGYYVAAGMLARAALECRTKRLALIAPGWRECRKSQFRGFVNHLRQQHVIDNLLRRQLENTYGRLSRLAHGRFVSRVHTCDVLDKTAELIADVNLLLSDHLSGHEKHAKPETFDSLKPRVAVA